MPRNPLGDGQSQRFGIAIVVVTCLVAPLWADIDPNASEPYADGGYGIIVCGNSAISADPNINASVKDFLRESFLYLTEDRGIEPDDVYVLVDDGEVDPNDDWTGGLFDPSPSGKSWISSAFEGIGYRLWTRPETPRNLVVIIAGEGHTSGAEPNLGMQLELPDEDVIYDDEFVADCVNDINYRWYGNGSPIERLEVIIAANHGAGLIDDLRDNVQALAGTTWPTISHVSILSAGDWSDATTGLFGLELLGALRSGGAGVPDLNGDEVLSIYEYFDHAAKRDLSNPEVPYAPAVPETIYVPGEDYQWTWTAEHPLYYEWNVTPLADPDPNESQRFPYGGYGVIICGDTNVLGIPQLEEWVKVLLRDTFLVLTDQLGFDANNVWVLVNDGEDDWTQGYFDALPADETNIAATFQTIGERMWDDANTPRNLVVLIAGHGTDSHTFPFRMMIELTNNNLIYDDDFVADCFDKINENAHNSSPIERFDFISTICASGGLIDDFRNYFHEVRGSTWPNADHLSIQTGGDWMDTTTSLFGIVLKERLKQGGALVQDLNGDGVLSVYEYFVYAAEHDGSNPDDEPNYYPWLPQTIYVPGQAFLPILGYREHPLYYEWNGTPMAYLTLDVINPAHGSVTISPDSTHPDAPYQYPRDDTVVLTAVPKSGSHFTHWQIYDPNDPNDVAIVTENPLTIAMDANRRVAAKFDCGPGIGQALPLLLVTMLACVSVSRRSRRSRPR